MARLLSVNVGQPREIAWRGKIVYTSVWKEPVEGRRLVRRLNIDGDAQGGPAGHGGEQRAVFVYQMDSYHYWERELQRRDFTFGQVRSLYLTKSGTGLRLGELLGLRESDLDMEHSLLSVQQTLKRPGRKALFGKPRTDRSRRVITLPGQIVEALRQLRRWKLEQRLRRGPRFTDYGLVLCVPSGKPLNANDIEVLICELPGGGGYRDPGRE